jgi:hypothetical protein
MSLRYPDDTIVLRPEEYCILLNEVPVLTIIENEEEHLCNQDLMNMEFTEQQIKMYFDDAVQKGMFSGYNGDVNMKNVIADIFKIVKSVYDFLLFLIIRTRD